MGGSSNMSQPLATVGGHTVTMGDTAQGNGMVYNDNTQSLQPDMKSKLQAFGAEMQGMCKPQAYNPEWFGRQSSSALDSSYGGTASSIGGPTNSFDDAQISQFLAWQKSKGY